MTESSSGLVIPYTNAFIILISPPIMKLTIIEWIFPSLSPNIIRIRLFYVYIGQIKLFAEIAKYRAPFVRFYTSKHISNPHFGLPSRSAEYFEWPTLL